MPSITTDVLARFKVDTKDAQRSLKKLRGAEREAAAESLRMAEQKNDSLDKQIAMWGKVAGAIGGVTAAVVVARKGFEAFREDAQLQIAATGANIDAMASSSRGLLKEQQLLKLAGQGLNSEFKSSQKELEIASKFVVTLRNRGVELEQALDKVGQAIQENNIEPLKEFGFVIDAQNETLDAHNAILARMAKENETVAANTELATDQITRQGVSTADAMQKIMVAVGQMAIAMEPLISALGGVAQSIAGIVDQSTAFDRMMRGRNKVDKILINAMQYEEGSAERQQLLDKALSVRVDEIYNRSQAKQRDFENQLALRSFAGGAFNIPAIMEGAKKFDGYNIEITESDVRRFEGSRKRAGSAGPKLMTAEQRELLALAIGATGGAGVDGITGGIEGAPISGAAFAGFTGGGSGIIDLGAGQQGMTERQKTLLQTVFGDPATFSAEVEIYSAGFQVLEGAVTSAYAAWIDGSKGIAEAIKDSIRQSLIAMGSQALVESLKHAALAIGAIAYGDPRGAAAHGIAAAKFAGVAAAAGVAAKAMGSGGGGAVSGSSVGGFSGSSAAGSGAGGGNSITVVVGDSFADMSPHERRARLSQSIVRAKTAMGSGEDVVTYG